MVRQDSLVLIMAIAQIMKAINPITADYSAENYLLLYNLPLIQELLHGGHTINKSVIIYASTHHGNTKKLVEAIADKYDIAQIDATKQQQADLSEYGLIGFASGIDFGKFHDSVEQFLKTNLPEEKRVFFLYTCAKVNRRFTEKIKAAAHEKRAIILGEYGCRGYNTYGPWKMIGGMNRKHPSEDEIINAVQFFASLLQTSR